MSGKRLAVSLLVLLLASTRAAAQTTVDVGFYEGTLLGWTNVAGSATTFLGTDVVFTLPLNGYGDDIRGRMNASATFSVPPAYSGHAFCCESNQSFNVLDVPLQTTAQLRATYTAPRDAKTHTFRADVLVTGFGEECAKNGEPQTVAAGASASVSIDLPCTIHRLSVLAPAVPFALRFLIDGVNLYSDFGPGFYVPVTYAKYTSVFLPVPKVDSMIPSIASPGTVEPLKATIYGSRFTPDAVVTIGDGAEKVTVLKTTFRSATQLEVELGGFAALGEGPRDVKVSVPHPTDPARRITGTGKDLFFVTGISIARCSPGSSRGDAARSMATGGCSVGLELNQGIRQVCGVSGRPPCVADHDTVIRASVTCGKDDSKCRSLMFGRLHVSKSGVPIDGSPFGTSATPLPDDADRRGQGLDTLNFFFRGSEGSRLAAGTYDFTFEIDPRNPSAYFGGPLDRNMRLTETLTSRRFEDSKGKLGVLFVVDLAGAGGEPDLKAYIDNTVRAYKAFRFADAVYPTSGITRFFLPALLEYPRTASTMASDIWSALNDFLYVFSFHPLAQDLNRTSALFFSPQVAPANAEGGIDFCRGGTSDCDRVSIVAPTYPGFAGEPTTADRVSIVAHHLGHHEGLGDTYAGGLAGAANPVCPDHVFGCPVEDGAFMTENLVNAAEVVSSGSFSFRDFMGITVDLRNLPRWTDERTWNYLHPRFNPASSTVRPRAAAAIELIDVQGTISSASATLLPARRRSAVPPPDPAPGDYAVELVGSGGAVLSSRSFAGPYQIVGLVDTASEAPFRVTLPFPPEARRIVLKKAGVELASRTISTGAPTVQVLSPNGGESLSGKVTVRWSASDPDGDALTYRVLYAADGVSYLPVVVALTSTSFDWETGIAAGSAAGRIKVVASDGVNEGSDVSDGSFRVAKKTPVVDLFAPVSGATSLVGASVTFQAVAFDFDDGELPDSALTHVSDRDGTIGHGGTFSTSALSAGKHTITLTARDSDGATATAAVAITVIAKPTGDPDESRFVPIVLSTAGVNGSFFTSELTLTNRGTTDATIQIDYTQAFGGGGGSAFDVLPAGRQRVVPDALDYLAAHGVLLPPTGNRGGTVSVKYTGLSSPESGSATVRTTTAVAQGRAGLSYPAIPPRLLTGTVYVAGLRQTATDRSNVAVQNAGGPGDGTVVLRLTVFSGDPSKPVSKVFPDVALAPGAFAQFSGILALDGLTLTNGYVKVERVTGTAPYFAYGVINDQITSDGSFVQPFAEDALLGKAGLTVPVVVETSTFSSELVATNWSSVKKTIRFSFAADAVTAPKSTALFTLEIAPGEQRVIPALVQYMREQHVAGIGAAGPTFAGALSATVDGSDARGVFLGVRTSSPSPGGGRFGLFYAGVPFGSAATSSAWIYGLRQDAENRSNLALVNTGELDESGSAYRIDLFDGTTGVLVKTIETSLPAKRWTQLSGILNQAPGTTNAYARVTKLNGNNPFVAYGVVNDGGAPNVRSDDGAFVAMEVERP